ncbi:g9384 [Coccomyxa elongata]
MGNRQSIWMGLPQGASDWNGGLHGRLLDSNEYEVSALLTDVSKMAWRGSVWPRLRDNVGMSFEVLKQMLAAIALDQMVKRIKPILPKSRGPIVPECRALTATWGLQEENGVITLHLQAPNGSLPSGLSIDHSEADNSARVGSSFSAQLGGGAGSGDSPTPNAGVGGAGAHPS